LQQLGFGTKQELNRFIKYIEELPAAQTRGPEVVLELLKTGTPAGFAVASRAVRTLPDLATVDSVIKTLEKQAVAGSKVAENTLMNIRAREIEDLLLKASSEGRVANLGSLTELADPAMRDNVERIIGRNLMNQIEFDVHPRIPSHRGSSTGGWNGWIYGSGCRARTGWTRSRSSPHPDRHGQRHAGNPEHAWKRCGGSWVLRSGQWCSPRVLE